MQKKIEPWEILKSQELFVAPPWIKLSVQHVRLPNGKMVDDYYQINLPEYAVVFAQTTDGRVIMERQYKNGVGKISFVLPGGLIEDGEDPLVTAKREFFEETGYVADDWQSLGSFVPNANYGCGKAHLFMAQGAKQVTEPNSRDLEDIEIVLMKLEEIRDAFRNGDIVTMSTMATIALATNPLFYQFEDTR